MLSTVEIKLKEKEKDLIQKEELIYSYNQKLKN
jgi:hypothetical protein